MKKILDHGYLQLVETWGSDERIIEAARMSTDKGFLGWGTPDEPGDERLLAYLMKNRHDTPFEMAGLIVEVQAPIFVFREWHRHRTQCLGPDTLIHFDAPKSKSNRRFVYKMRIEDLWKKWQPTQRNSRPERQVNALFPRSRIQAMQLRCLNEETSEFVTTNIVDVIKGDPKPMVRVTVASGRELVATREHRVFTNEGWRTLGCAIDGNLRLTLEGTVRGNPKGWEPPQPDLDAEAWRDVVGWEGIYVVSNMGRVARRGKPPRRVTIGSHGYPVVSLNRPGLQDLRTVHTLVLEAFVGRRAEFQEARHINHNRQDARLQNLQWGSSSDNSFDQVSADRQQRLIPCFEEIVRTIDLGPLPTYDLTVTEPWHNFVADGFVVHNSFNELSARYTPLPDMNYMPTAERCLVVNGANKQANNSPGSRELTHDAAIFWLEQLKTLYVQAEDVYRLGLEIGIPKELARLPVPVARYSRMRASANLRNWLAFLTLRQAPNAQYEIRVFANALGEIIAEKFPRTWELFLKRSA